MVVYRDGSVMAQLALPDMRIPIAYALSYPERMKLGLSRLSLSQCGHLSFEKPDYNRFPALLMAFEASRMRSVLNLRRMKILTAMGSSFRRGGVGSSGGCAPDPRERVGRLSPEWTTEQGARRPESRGEAKERCRREAFGDRTDGVAFAAGYKKIPPGPVSVNPSGPDD